MGMLFTQHVYMCHSLCLECSFPRYLNVCFLTSFSCWLICHVKWSLPAFHIQFTSEPSIFFLCFIFSKKLSAYHSISRQTHTLYILSPTMRMYAPWREGFLYMLQESLEYSNHSLNACWPGVVVQTCNPSFLGSQGRWITGCIPAWQLSVTLSQKMWWVRAVI
jgi:hypothetical protein